MGKKKCDLCEGVARMYCESDQASLCWDCDGKVHGANFLVAKHTRCLLCTSCQSLTPWKATGLRLGPTFSVCESCVAFKSAAAGGDGVGSGSEDHRLVLGDDDDGYSAESYDDDEDEDEEYSDEDEDVEEEEAENQVVPWSAEAAAQLPPTMSSSSSDGGDLAGKRRRDCSDDEIGSSSAQESNYSPPLKRPSREEPAFESTAAINSLNQIRRREHHIE
ncbi:B-box type zinc finger family protein [Raphanus sativus]|uniref:Zinc finger protein CONSTANS-LIKE 4 n=1 Tax=Raphanus sativus TaxID=3726 RepID=A0A6J0KSW1_RAPSA|nr:zinc finger protein CONSTANS-LIKE 4 [Raphanus sativus]KAJ4880434.1 B-box type zinc finger family protein [Raphanus sativus]